MSFKKILITFVLFFSMLGISGSVLAEAAKKTPEMLQEIDVKIQAALDRIATGNAEEVTALIKEIKDDAGELSANYKFEFERDKVIGRLKAALKSSKKSDLAGAEQELKDAKEGFAKLKSFL